VPSRYVERLGLPVDNQKYLVSQSGQRRVVNVYALDVGIADIRLPAMEIVADERGADVIVGRNILNRLNITLRGPQRELEIHDRD